MPTLEYIEVLRTTTCWCGIHLAIPDNLLRRAKESNSVGIYCPLGHKFFFSESEADKLRKQLERAQSDRDWHRQRQQAERDLREHTERQLSAQKAATTKARKRHAAGVCPACKRTFQDVQRHMHSKHPDFDPAAS